MTLDLTPDVERRLRQEAERRGVEADVYAAQLIERQLPPQPDNSDSLWDRLTPEEWKKELRAYVESHDPTLPPLAPEAYERASFYEDAE
jgi:hypothetical protein